MKRTSEENLLNASAKARALANKTFRNPVTSLLTLGLLFSLAITTYSQETIAPAPAAEVSDLTLPADNVALTDVNGRTITVTVLSMAADKLSIVIRTADGNEMPILTSRLNTDTLEKLMGGKGVPAMPVVKRKETHAERQVRVKAEDKVRAEISAKLKDLNAYELHKRFLAGDEDVLTLLLPGKNSWEDRAAVGTASDPNWARYNRSGYSLLATVEVKPPNEEEKVSLRPQFEKLGVVAHKQTGDTCSLYSAYHLFQFACLSDGGNPPSLEQLQNSYWEAKPRREMHLPEKMVTALTKAYGKRPTVQWFDVSHPKLSLELVKHQLRKGKACIIIIQGGSHAVVAVGFHAKDGVTTFEYLNSNQLYIDKGYGTTPYAEASPVNYSVWFE